MQRFVFSTEEWFTLDRWPMGADRFTLAAVEVVVSPPVAPGVGTRVWFRDADGTEGEFPAIQAPAEVREILVAKGSRPIR